MSGRKIWTDEDVAYLRKNWGKITRLEIAQHLECCICAVAVKARKLGLSKKKTPCWTEQEINLLSDLWGHMTLKTIARKMNRTENSINIKARRIGLGPTKDVDGRITACVLARTLGIDRHVIIDNWIAKCGLKHVRKITKNIYKFRLIDLDDFWSWAEKNQERFDSRRFEEGDLGAEPAWMVQKRQTDHLLPSRRLKKWTRGEDNELRTLFKAGHLTYREIGKRLGRSENAIGRRITKIDIWQPSRSKAN